MNLSFNKKEDVINLLQSFPGNNRTASIKTLEIGQKTNYTDMCLICCSDWQYYIRKTNPNINLSLIYNGYHTVLAFPVYDEKNKDIMIFDPTIKQFITGVKYFLGSSKDYEKLFTDAEINTKNIIEKLYPEVKHDDLEILRNRVQKLDSDWAIKYTSHETDMPRFKVYTEQHHGGLFYSYSELAIPYENEEYLKEMINFDKLTIPAQHTNVSISNIKTLFTEPTLSVK